MKRLLSYFMLLVLIVSTVGINVSTHYCGSDYVGSVVNGFTFVSEEGEAMQGCMDKDNDCPHCKNVKHSYRILSQFLKGQTAQTQPVSIQLDRFNAPAEQVDVPQPVVTEIAFFTPYHYTPPGLPDALLTCCGLRAPPFTNIR